MRGPGSALGVVVLVLLVGVVGCDDEKKEAAPDLRPVADGGPYLCDLIPERAFRRSTGLTTPVIVKWAGPQTDNGLCLARAEGRDAPLGVRWSYNAADKTLRFMRDKRSRVPTYSVPADLGQGLVALLPFGSAYPRPNYVIAAFHCGKKRPWISIDFAPVVSGRDAVRDMVDIMRIAERRFGEIHKCTPKPS